MLGCREGLIIKQLVKNIWEDVEIPCMIHGFFQYAGGLDDQCTNAVVELPDGTIKEVYCEYVKFIIQED